MEFAICPSLYMVLWYECVCQRCRLLRSSESLYYTRGFYKTLFTTYITQYVLFITVTASFIESPEGNSIE